MIASLRLRLARWLLPRGWHAHRDPRCDAVSELTRGALRPAANGLGFETPDDLAQSIGAPSDIFDP